MTPQDFRNLLEQTLADQTLNRSEKGVLRAALHTLQPDERQRAVFRSQAFDLARAAVSSSPQQAAAILDWLEEVLKSLVVSQQAEPTPAEVWFSPNDNCVARIRSFLAASKKTADLCVFTITDDRLTEAIIDAHQRGVRVRIITDDEKSLDPGSDISRLTNAGIPLRMDRSQYHMHHKFAVVDGESLLNGSFNWTRGAAENNEENFVISNDPRLVKAFVEAFETLWKQVG
jgi:phosphatidylserine/phosphatidylglycerophosphate/cardiolipin synthase-like enzyme